MAKRSTSSEQGTITTTGGRSRRAANGPASTQPARPDGPRQQPQPTMLVTHDQIAQRAYEIWVAKGRPPGRDLENWRQAEIELRGATAAR